MPFIHLCAMLIQEGKVSARYAGKESTLKKESGPEIDPEKVIFTRHALDRFRERFLQLNGGGKLSSPERTARKILARATEEGALSPVGRVKRLIDNRFQEARYFMSNGWRFVINDNNGIFTVLTIERDIFKRQ